MNVVGCFSRSFLHMRTHKHMTVRWGRGEKYQKCISNFAKKTLPAYGLSGIYSIWLQEEPTLYDVYCMYLIQVHTSMYIVLFTVPDRPFKEGQYTSYQKTVKCFLSLGVCLFSFLNLKHLINVTCNNLEINQIFTWLY